MAHLVERRSPDVLERLDDVFLPLGTKSMATEDVLQPREAQTIDLPECPDASPLEGIHRHLPKGKTGHRRDAELREFQP